MLKRTFRRRPFIDNGDGKHNKPSLKTTPLANLTTNLSQIRREREPNPPRLTRLPILVSA